MNGQEDLKILRGYMHDPNTLENVKRILSKLKYPVFVVLPNKRVKAEKPVFSHPVVMKSGVWISQHFGENPANYYPLKGHDGLDYAVMTGADCMCTTAWQKVTNLILQTNSYGRHAWTIDEYGHRHIYGHLSEFLCQEGQELTRGMVFARTGGGSEDPYKGYSTGPHLHWEWRPTWASISNGYAGAEDQEPYITYSGAVTPIPVPQPEPLYWLIANTKLKIRTTPKATIWGNITGRYVEKGEKIPVYGTKVEGRLWAKISMGELYTCIEENGEVYLEPVSSDE